MDDLLQENGDHVLQEDGASLLLLEQQAGGGVTVRLVRDDLGTPLVGGGLVLI